MDSSPTTDQDRMPDSMRALLMIKAREAGLSRSDRLSLGMLLLDDPHKSWSELTRQEAGVLLDALEGWHLISTLLEQRVRAEPPIVPVASLPVPAEVLEAAKRACQVGMTVSEFEDFAEYLLRTDLFSWEALTAEQAERLIVAFDGYHMVEAFRRLSF